MNTLQIINKIKQDVVDKDSFGIIKDYVKKMEEYDDHILNTKTKKMNKLVLEDLELIFESLHIKEQEDIVLKDEAVAGLGIKTNYSKKILKQIDEMEKDRLNEIEWERLNGFTDSYDMYDDYLEYGMYEEEGFLGWSFGASCDI